MHQLALRRVLCRPSIDKPRTEFEEKANAQARVLGRDGAAGIVIGAIVANCVSLSSRQDGPNHPQFHFETNLRIYTMQNRFTFGNWGVEDGAHKQHLGGRHPHRCVKVYT